MTRNIFAAILPVLACAGFAPAQAAPTTTVLAVTAKVGNYCNLPSNNSLAPAVTATRANNVVTFGVTNANILTLSINCNVRSSLQLKATALKLNTVPSNLQGKSAVLNYTATASPWSSNPSVSVNETTANPATLTTFTGTAVNRDAANPTNVTVTLSNIKAPGTLEAYTGNGNGNGSQNYSGNITVVLTPGT